MNPYMQTVRTQAAVTAADTSRDAILVHIYPTGPEMGSRYPVGTRALVVGRGDNCDIRINDSSVSRRHAMVQAGEGGWSVTDLGSTNGTFLNNAAVESASLRDGDYLRIGNCIYRFLTGGNVEAQYHEEIYRLTIIDGLTEIHNKRYLLEYLDRELARCERYGRPLSLVLFDIDRFKRINDDLGHLAGDAVLRQMSFCVREKVRKEELFARYGGEEFAAVLPETPCEDATLFAERIREAVADHRFGYDGEVIPVTVSVGVATTAAEVPRPAELISWADRALYRAKHDGRNCVRVWAGDQAAAPQSCESPAS
jgi:diguanylate cyclase (GGDEF)-like protein